MAMQRTTTMENALRALVNQSVPVGAVLDVGIQSCTGPLMAVFPRVHHFLVEPVSSYFPNIIQIYNSQNISFEIIHAAMDQATGTIWLAELSSDASGAITHSQIIANPSEVARFQQPVVSLAEVRQISLDGIYDELVSKPGFAAPLLLKLDVDGVEERILAGGSRFLEQVSILVLEVPLAKFHARLNLVAEQGFVLMDIVDPCYYFGVLSQVDLIFVHKRIFSENRALDPWRTNAQISWDDWQPAPR